MLEQFKFCPELQKLLTEAGCKVLHFRDLPRTHQLAIAHYMSVDGAAWAFEHPEFEDWEWGEGTPYEPEERLKMLKDLDDFLPRFVQYFGDDKFGMAEVSCLKLQEIIAAYNPDYEPSYFDKLIQDQIEGLNKKPEYKTPTWPSILMDSEEILQDGWTRFHNRIAQGIELTPIVWYA